MDFVQYFLDFYIKILCQISHAPSQYSILCAFITPNGYNAKFVINYPDVIYRLFYIAAVLFEQ